MTIKLQQATEADFLSIKALIHQVQINPMGLDWRNFIIAVDSQGKMIGCGQIKMHGDGSQELASIAVVPEQRRQGVAHAIIEHLIDSYFKGQNTSGSPSEKVIDKQPLYLTCRSSLGSFYQLFGFYTIEPKAMPPYFRRISRIARIIGKVLRMEESMLVMRLDNPK